jgi:hypothetical protein
MRKVVVGLAAVTVLACSAAYGQVAPATQGFVTPVDPSGTAPAPTQPLVKVTAAQWRLSVIQWYMTFPSPLLIGDMRLHGMGDEAAFDIYSLMATRAPLTQAETLTALDIIHKSFARPIAIQNPADRKPVHSLALLKMFQATAVDQTVKERIAIETNYLNSVPANPVAPPVGVPGPPPPHGTTPFF